ncbi:MAG: hypothetical protein DWI23_04265 [Planctomycetota bacterium]|jgi:hypothetical protein|nr:MAG: hypothetical protein DWI23_04265 [Planctomycetota bacterium]
MFPFRSSHTAPEQSGGRLIDPPVVPSAEAPADSIETLIDNNRLLRAAFNTRIGDLRLWELVAATRREVLTVASEYTSNYRDIERPSDMADWIARPIVMGGHQPELFHPGVWLKNSALDAYARAVSGTAINLVVDSDRCVRTTVGVPIGSPHEAHLEEVPFDSPAAEMAWEERGILDPDLFASFGDRASDLLKPLEPNPILRRWWPLAVERAGECHRLGLAMAQARHSLEARFGLETLELPVSELCRLPTVMVFMGWLLAHARQLHEAYNATLTDYRRTHRQRGRARPMPDLVMRIDNPSDGPWFEVPWWIWSQDDPRRRRVFANTNTSGMLVLSDMETLRVELPISPETSPSKWVDALSRMEEHALRLRPRAIITTLVARLLVADVFVHGIGGAVYDQLTDDLVRRLTGCDPPRYAVVSGTLRLPVDAIFGEIAASDPGAELARVHHALRDLEFHPERHLVPTAAQPEHVRELIAQKARWIETFPTPTLAQRRCREIRASNDRLAYHTQPVRSELLGRVGPLAAGLRAQKLLQSREYPWCFFTEKTLKMFLLLEND